MLQLYEWVETLRLTGKLAPSSNTTPAFLSLLNAVGQASESAQRKPRLNEQKVQLKKSEIHQIVASGHASMGFHVDPCAISQDKLLGERGQHTVTWHTREADSGKSTCAHFVCWHTGFQPFKKFTEVQDLDDFHFGSISKILKVNIFGKDVYFMHMEKYTTVNYQFGGIWICDKGAIEQTLIPVECVSEPLITATQQATPNTVAVLNSKAKFMPTEARTILQHIGLQE